MSLCTEGMLQEMLRVSVEAQLESGCDDSTDEVRELPVCEDSKSAASEASLSSTLIVLKIAILDDLIGILACT
jgi:hypothetical protein